MVDSNIIALHEPLKSTGEHPQIATDIDVLQDGKQILKGINIAPSSSGITVILGPNGAGKSMLLKVLAGLIKPTGGTITPAPNDIGYVPQTPTVLNRTLRHNLIHALKYAKIPRNARPGRLAELLVQFRLADLSETQAQALSGGERHKLAIARAMARRPHILLFDEPTANLDPAATAEIEDLVIDLQAQGHIIIWVTHDIAQAKRIGDDVLFLQHGRLIDQRPRAAFFSNPHPVAADYIAGRLPKVLE
ncbi:MAG: ATP-binding cassette domain-containing protein [Halocynthiibacter sp.]